MPRVPRWAGKPEPCRPPRSPTKAKPQLCAQGLPLCTHRSDRGHDTGSCLDFVRCGRCAQRPAQTNTASVSLPRLLLQAVPGLAPGAEGRAA